MRLRISFKTSTAMILCLGLSRSSRPSNHFRSAVMLSSASSAIFFLSMRKCSDSFFSLAPWHTGQVFTMVKSTIHFFANSDPSSRSFSRKLMIPSNLVFHSVPGYFAEATDTGMSSPYNRILITSLGISSTGVVRASLYRFKIASTFLKIQMSRYSPRGKIAPRLMLFDLSGITDSSVISSICPRPLHSGQAPYGELNEKLFGAGSS